MVNTDILKKIYLFEGFSDADLKQVADIVREKDVIAGDAIFDEGGEATSLFILKSGTVEILKKGNEDEQRVAAFSGGSHFGEMAFLDKSRRTASAIAKENCRLLEIGYAELEQLTQRQERIGFRLYKNLAQALSRRIRQTTVDLSTLRDLKLRHL